MLQTFTLIPAGSALAANTPINFNINKVLKGCTVRHTEGASNIYLRAPGVYKVDFNGIFVASSDATPISIQMLNNNVEVPDAKAIETSSSNTDYANVSFSSFVTVAPSCRAVDNTATLSFINLNADVMILANVTVLEVR